MRRALAALVLCAGYLLLAGWLQRHHFARATRFAHERAEASLEGITQPNRS